MTSITKALKNSLDQGNVRVIYFHCIEAFNGFSLLVCEYRVHLVLMWASNSGLKIAFNLCLKNFENFKFLLVAKVEFPSIA